MSARASARTLSARASFSAVRDRYSQGASTTARPASARTVMAITSGSCWIWLCWAMTRPNAAPTRPSPTTTRTSAGQPPRATNGASQTFPPASARHRFCCALSACRQTSAAPAQANATGQNSCWLIPSPLVCTIQSSPVPRAASASSMPQSGRRAGLAVLRRPCRVAASRPGAWVGGCGGSSSHSAPYAIAPEELDQQQPDETDPDHHHRPAQVPGQAGADTAEHRALGHPGGPWPVRRGRRPGHHPGPAGRLRWARRHQYARRQPDPGQWWTWHSQPHTPRGTAPAG